MSRIRCWLWGHLWFDWWAGGDGTVLCLRCGKVRQ